jgi:hypothetical protein
MAVAIQFDLSVVVGASNPPAGSQPESFYTENQFTSLTANTSTNNYAFTCYQVIMGTGISITETTGNMNYYEVVQGLRNNLEPYFFDNISIYATDIDQANQLLLKKEKDSSGFSFKNYNYPAISPSQADAQSIIINEPMNFLPKTINRMEYTVLAHTAVTLIINYTKGNLNAILDLMDSYIKEGISFNQSIYKLEEKVNKKQEKYLKEKLKAIWSQKKKQYSEKSIELEIEHIFDEKKITKEKKEALNKIKSQVKLFMTNEKLKDLDVDGLSSNNIKKMVANYVAKGKADDMHDEYNYSEGK